MDKSITGTDRLGRTWLLMPVDKYTSKPEKILLSDGRTIKYGSGDSRFWINRSFTWEDNGATYCIMGGGMFGFDSNEYIKYVCVLSADSAEKEKGIINLSSDLLKKGTIVCFVLLAVGGILSYYADVINIVIKWVLTLGLTVGIGFLYYKFGITSIKDNINVLIYRHNVRKANGKSPLGTIGKIILAYFILNFTLSLMGVFSLVFPPLALPYLIIMELFIPKAGAVITPLLIIQYINVYLITFLCVNLILNKYYISKYGNKNVRDQLLVSM